MTNAEALASMVTVGDLQSDGTCNAWMDSADRRCGKPATYPYLCDRHVKVAMVRAKKAAEKRLYEAQKRAEREPQPVHARARGVAGGATVSLADWTCATCTTEGRRGSCCPGRCYCGHDTCHAFASWKPLPVSNVTPITKATAAHADSWANREESTWIDKL